MKFADLYNSEEDKEELDEEKLNTPNNIAKASNMAEDMKNSLLDFGDELKKYTGTFPEIKRMAEFKSFSTNWKGAMKDWNKLISQLDKMGDRL